MSKKETDETEQTESESESDERIKEGRDQTEQEAHLQFVNRLLERPGRKEESVSKCKI